MATRALETAMRQQGHAGNKLIVHFLGGEPLLNYKLIQEFSRYLVNHGLREQVALSLTTNGTLITPDIASELQEDHFKIFLSMDSQIPTEQNALRPLGSGSGSYPQVWRSLDLLRGYSELAVQITMTRVQQDLLGTILSYFDSGVAVKLSACMLPPSEAASLRLSAEQINSMFAGLVDYLIERKIGQAALKVFPLRSTASVLMKRQSFGMCGGATSSLSVGSDGVLYPCDPFVGHADFSIGSLDKGIDEKRRNQFILHGLNRLKEQCKNCPYTWVCGGGCTAFSVTHQGDPERVDEYYCAYVEALVKNVKKLVHSPHFKNAS